MCIFEPKLTEVPLPSTLHYTISARGNTTPSHSRRDLKQIMADSKLKNNSPSAVVSSRSWCFTSFEKNPPEFRSEFMQYLIFGSEICPSTKKDHFQGYIYGHDKLTLILLKNKIGFGVHFEKCKGSPQSNIDYCKKDGKYQEFGTPPCQGARTDIREICDQISKGLCVDDIAKLNPSGFHQYGRTFQKIEDIRLRAEFRTEMTECEWIYGPTGYGKSTYAFKDYSPSTHYLYRSDKGWWEGYIQQHTVIINDFRGCIPYNELLQLCDKFPYFVRRRGREPMPFTSKRIIITSVLTPEEVYSWQLQSHDSISQLLRRIKVKHIVLNKD